MAKKTGSRSPRKGAQAGTGAARPKARSKKPRGRVSTDAHRRKVLREVFDLLPVPVFVTYDRDARVAEINRAAQEALGLKSGQNPSKTASPESAPGYKVYRDGREADPWSLPLQVAARDGVTVKDDPLEVRLESGATLFVRGSATPLTDEDGKWVGAVATFADVTDRHRADEAARALELAEAMQVSEERLRTVMEASTDGFWDRDLVKGQVFHSARMNEMVGLPPADTVVDTDEWRARVHPDDLRVLAPEYDRVLRGQQDRVDSTYRVRCEDGSWKWVRTRAKAVERDERGSPLRISGVLTDVTEQRRLEEALRTSEELFRVAFENSSVGMALMSPEGRPIRVNRTLCEMLGYTEQELLKLSWRDLTHPDDLEPTTQQIRRATSAPEDGGRLEKRYVRKDGTEIWADVSSRAVLADGKVRHFITSVVDITDRKLAQEALRQSELRFRQLANEIPVGIYQTGPNGEMRFVNPAWLRITGLSEAEAFGPDAGDVIHPEDRERVVRLWNAAISTGTEFSGDYRLRGRDGRDAWVRGFGAAVRKQDGVVTSYVGALIDISEARRLQAELAQASRLTAMGTLVAGVAHEINNPLAATLANQGLVLELARGARDEVLAGRSNEDAQVRELSEIVEALEEAQASAIRISEIVKDMATFANPNPKRTRIRLADIVQGAMRWLPSSMNLSGRIQVEDHGAPEIMAASGQLEQVVHNLLTNAARASSETLAKVVVRIGPGSPGMARLEVVDHGVGIPEANVDRIFEPFYTTRPAGVGRGAGLGLAISRAIIVAHGGSITVESEVGKGSTFAIELPAARVEA